MKFSIIFSILLLLTSVFVSADSSNYRIDSVYVNGIEVTDSNRMQVELGSTVQVQVYLEGTGESEDVRVSAWIGGYEYDSIDTSSEVFEVEDGVSYKKVLSIDIPEDLDVSEHEYILHVEVYDSSERETEEYTLYIEQERHDIVIEDILLSATSVAPGDYLGVKVRLENQGAKDEEDLKITVSIPELGISSRVYMDELVSGEQESATSAYLVIPSDASGDYEVLVSVEYNNGYSEVSESAYIAVEGEMIYDENTFVSISSMSDLVAGEESSYKVQVTNLADEAKTFSLTVEGLDASYIESIRVPAQSSGEFIFTLYPEEAGTAYVFVEVGSDEGLVTQELYTVTIEDKSSALVVLVSILIAVLVAGFIIIYLRKL